MKGRWRWLDALEEYSIAFLMALTTLVIFLAVVHRYGSGLPVPYVQDWLLRLDLGWAQEFAIICAVWMAKIGAAYGVRTGIHVGVDLLTQKLHGTAQRVVVTISLLAGLVFCLIIAWFGARFVWENGLAYALLSALGRDTGAYFEGPVTPDLEWPTWAVYSIIPLGAALMGWRFFEVLNDFWRTGHLPRHEIAHVADLEGTSAQGRQ